MKIALVNPRIESYSSTLPPLGLLYIAAVLEKNGYEVRIFDIYPYDDRDLDSLVRYKPDIIGMTVLTDYWSRARYIARFIRDKIVKSTFIVGGVHVTVLPEESIRGLDADIGVIGEGEYTMLELCERLIGVSEWDDIKGIVYRDQKGKFVYTQPRLFIENLNELPFPARHLLNFEDYLIPPGIIRGHWSERSTTVMTSRGCPFQCIWCGSQSTFGRKVRRRSVENVIDELKQIIRDFKVDTVW
ncbi:MAG: B12-binding domain-containing radical SAM protein, partial [Candidatus Omnitrophica bacterium]|nr:B12-binding domain-containing radical SAM protein [Candidatus Omnitrophota bacterium]